MTTPRHIIGIDKATGPDETAFVVVEMKAGKPEPGKVFRFPPPTFEQRFVKWCERFPVIGRWLFLWWLIAKRVWVHGWACQWDRRNAFWSPPISPRDYAFFDLLSYYRDMVLKAYRIPQAYLKVTPDPGRVPSLTPSLEAARIHNELVFGPPMMLRVKPEIERNRIAEKLIARWRKKYHRPESGD